MSAIGTDDGDTRVSGLRALRVRALTGDAREPELRFTRAFTIGSGAQAEFQVHDEGVAPAHAQLIGDGILWWIRDLSGAAGTFVNGVRVKMVPLRDTTELELGAGGPRIRLEVERGERAPVPATATPEVPEAPAHARAARPEAVPPAEDPRPTRTEPTRTEPTRTEPTRAEPTRVEPMRPEPTHAAAEPRDGGFVSETAILRRFLRKDRETPAGHQTMLFRKAFDRVQKRSRLPYQIAAAVAAAALIVAGMFIVQQQRKLRSLRETAERLFYATRAVEVEIGQLEEVVLARSDRKDLSALLDRKARFSQMEAEYDAFVKELGVYAKLPEDEQLILRTARAFGECEVNVPPDFIAEVKRYIQRWKGSDRLTNAMKRSAEMGYGAAIQRVLVESGLPRQFVYLPLVESNYDERAVGPPTRYGHAKGMWQFISTTADHYGLKIGPRYEEPAYDPRDERFEWQKATTAAARYIRELSTSDAQSSGLLVMACYNWGETNVRALLEKLPATPQDRNLWRLLRDKKMPKETYDYVLSIFSAAVICEDPGRFGLALTCPAMQSLAEGKSAGTAGDTAPNP